METFWRPQQNEPTDSGSTGIGGLGGDLLGPPAGVDNLDSSGQATDPRSLLIEAAYRRHGGRLSGHGHEGHRAGHAHHGPEPPATPAEKPASINEMVAQSVDLNRIAKNDPQAPDFDIDGTDERTFKGEYVQQALRVGRSAGFSDGATKDIIKGLYSVEDGGWGTHDTMAGMTEPMVAPDSPGTHDKSDARRAFVPVTSAIGYNQIIRSTTLSILHSEGAGMSQRLDEMAKLARLGGNDQRYQALEEKAKLVSDLRTTIDKQAMSMPDARRYLDNNGNPTWNLYSNFADNKTPQLDGLTGKQIASAVHALNLDKDIGPLLQAENLKTLLDFAHQNHLVDLLDSKVRVVKTRAAAYDHLDSTRQSHAVDAVMNLCKQSATNLPGFDQGEQQQALTSVENKLRSLHTGVDKSLVRSGLTAAEDAVLRSLVTAGTGGNDSSRQLSPDGRLLLAKIADSYFDGADGNALLPAALELANLAGTGRALEMLQPTASRQSAAHFFDRAGYKRNPITHHRTTTQLLDAIDQQMDNAGKNGKAGIAELMMFLCCGADPDLVRPPAKETPASETPTLETPAPQ